MKKIILTAISIIILAVGVWYFVYQRPIGTPNLKINEREKACLDSDGKVATANCCQSVSDFPNLCLIGACGCSLENSKEVKICDCGNGCWDGIKCVKVNIDTTDWKVYLNPKYPYSMKYPADWKVTHNFGPHEMLVTGYAESNVFESPSGYALVFAVVLKDGDVASVPRTGVAAGDFVDSDETVMVADVKVGMKKLVFEGKVKELFINDFEIDGYKGKAYISYFGGEDYLNLEMTGVEELKIAKEILASFSFNK